MQAQYEVNGRTWQVEDSFFDGCIDLESGEDVVTVLETATDQEVFEALREV